MPIYRADDLPDLGECTAISRGVPVLPSGMEKEEEGEHHLQRAISAQQAFGHTGELVIPTPEVLTAPAKDYGELYQSNYKLPGQLIHMQLFAIEQDYPDYDMDSEDEEWFQKNAKVYPDLTNLKFERLMDKFEQQQLGRSKALELPEAKLIAGAKTAEEENLVTEIYDYWVEKRLKTQIPLRPTVRQEKREGASSKSPYIAFRKRTEKMQTRKNRKNDEASYEKMLKLKRDLNRAVNLLDLVKKRERMKRDHLNITVDIFKKRYELGDYSGQILAEVTALQSMRSHNNLVHRDQDSKASSKSLEGHARKRREYRKKQNNVSQNRTATDQYEFEDSDEDTFKHRTDSDDDGDDEDEDSPDGPYTFKRKGGCHYLAPRQEIGYWPWCSNDDSSSKYNKYKYCLTYLSAGPVVERCIGLARRRVGRGGRIVIDRILPPENYMGDYVADCY
jgi:enhancer of polycomb-like protein